MMPTLILARNTFREAIRDRLLATVLVFGGVMVTSSIVLAPLTLGEESRVVRDLGLAAISLFTVLMIVMVGTGLVYREIERQTIYTILTLPVRRFEFVLGKFLGLCCTILFSIAMLSIVYLAVVAGNGGGIHPNLFVALWMTALEAIVVVSVAIFFSTVASPLLSAVFTFFVWVSGHMVGDIRVLTEQQGNDGLRIAAEVMYVILPSLHNFDVRNNLLSDAPIDPAQIGYCSVYTLLFSGALLLITIAVFQRRDFE